MPKQTPQIGRRKRPDLRPARARYWATKQLEKHKVRDLVRCCGMERVKALVYWRSVRKKRMKDFSGATAW